MISRTSLRSSLSRPTSAASVVGRFVVCVLPLSLTIGGLAVWLLTGVAIVAVDEVGVYRRLGAVDKELLRPGLHVVLPHPFGRVTRVRLKAIDAVTVGFSANLSDLSRVSLLWTLPHGGREFPFVVGDGSELAVVNALVQYKISERPGQVIANATSFRSPASLVSPLAQRALRQELGATSLSDILTVDRARLQVRLRQVLQQAFDREQLGLEVVEFGVLSIHPPLETAPAFLDVVSAYTDAEKTTAVAQLNAEAELLRCQRMSALSVAEAKVAASKATQRAAEQVTLFSATARSWRENDRVVKQRLLCDTTAEVLHNRPVTLLDAALPPGVQIWFDDAKQTP